MLGVFVGARVEARFAPAPGSLPVFVELPVSLLLWTATLGSGVFLGLGIALVLASPILDLLSRQVEALARGRVGDSGKGLRWEAGQALRGSLYFLAAAPGVFLLGLIPIVGPFLSVAWGGRAVAFQMTDPALSRRGLAFREKRRLAPRVAAPRAWASASPGWWASSCPSPTSCSDPRSSRAGRCSSSTSRTWRRTAPGRANRRGRRAGPVA